MTFTVVELFSLSFFYICSHSFFHSIDCVLASAICKFYEVPSLSIFVSIYRFCIQLNFLAPPHGRLRLNRTLCDLIRLHYVLNNDYRRQLIKSKSYVRKIDVNNILPVKFGIFQIRHIEYTLITHTFMYIKCRVMIIIETVLQSTAKSDEKALLKSNLNQFVVFDDDVDAAGNNKIRFAVFYFRKITLYFQICFTVLSFFLCWRSNSVNRLSVGCLYFCFVLYSSIAGKQWHTTSNFFNQTDFQYQHIKIHANNKKKYLRPICNYRQHSALFFNMMIALSTA